MPPQRHHPLHAGFGLRFTADFPLPPLPEAPPTAGRPAVALRAADAEAFAAAWSGTQASPVWETVFPGLGALTLEIGPAGDHLHRLDGVPAYHISPAADGVLCGATDPPDLARQRFLLDTVLWTVSLLHGHQALHAGAIVWETGPVAVAAQQGGGKTSLLAELLGRGHALFTDDVVAISPDPDGGPPLAHPGPPLLNVPMVGAGAADSGALGTRLGVLEAEEPEAWHVLSTQPESARLRAVILLRRLAGGEPTLRPADASIFDLLMNSISLRHLMRSQRERFVVLSDLLASVPVLELSASAHHPPPALADALERDLEGLMARGVA